MINTIMTITDKIPFESAGIVGLKCAMNMGVSLLSEALKLSAVQMFQWKR